MRFIFKHLAKQQIQLILVHYYVYLKNNSQTGYFLITKKPPLQFTAKTVFKMKKKGFPLVLATKANFFFNYQLSIKFIYLLY